MTPYHDSDSSSSSSSSSRLAYHQVSLAEEGDALDEKFHDILDERPTSRPHSLREIWARFVEMPTTLIVAGSFATTVLLLIVITSFTVHTPGSYVRIRTLSQQNTLQPEYVDSFGGPIELGGTHDCDSYPSQAASLGCVFDLMNFGWTPPQCYYEDPSVTGISRGPYKFYLDANLTVEIPQDVALTGRVVDVYTTRHYHFEHCKWSQAVLAMAKENDNVLIPQVIAQQNHTMHCQNYIEQSEGRSMEKVETWTRVVYNSCIKLSEADSLIVTQ